jgi:hypothetical protein
MDTADNGASPTPVKPDALNIPDNWLANLVGSADRKFGFIITRPLGAARNAAERISIWF